MKLCDKCNQFVTDGEEEECNAKLLCEDCYIDMISDKARKTHYLECDHSFMLRLKPGFDNHRLLEQKTENEKIHPNAIVKKNNHSSKENETNESKQVRFKRTTGKKSRLV